jgi:hypothetical protein
MRNPILIALLLFSGIASAATAQKTSDRIHAFSKLPNWSGLWVQAVWPPGRVAGGKAKLREGLQLIRQPPYNAECLAKYQAGLADTAAIAARNASFVACTPSFPALMESPWIFQVLVLPEETLILFENGQVRHIYTDGRRHPSGDDLWPMRLGDSIGHWEGDALRIDTVARDSTEPMAPRVGVDAERSGAFHGAPPDDRPRHARRPNDDRRSRRIRRALAHDTTVNETEST